MKMTDLEERIDRYLSLHNELISLRSEITVGDAEHAKNRAQALMDGDAGRTVKNPADAKRARLRELEDLLPHAEQILNHSAIEYRNGILFKLDAIHKAADSVIVGHKTRIAAELKVKHDELLDLVEGPDRQLQHLISESTDLAREVSPAHIVARVKRLSDTYGVLTEPESK